MSPAPDKTEAEKAEDAIMDTYLANSFGIPPEKPKEPVAPSPEDADFDAYMSRSFPS